VVGVGVVGRVVSGAEVSGAGWVVAGAVVGSPGGQVGGLVEGPPSGEVVVGRSMVLGGPTVGGGLVEVEAQDVVVSP
jgi:hypothetical protein